MSQVVLAHMGYGGQVVQGQALLEMIFNITAHYGTFFAGLMNGRYEGDGKLAVPHEKKKYDLQQVLADGAVAGKLSFDFF